MVQRICPTCKGMRRVRQGTRVYVCPMCKGSGGVALGEPTPQVPPKHVSGQSRASEHIGRYRVPSLG